MRLVLDTNVLLAGFATHGLCEALLKIVYRDHIVILSEHLLDEVSWHFSGKFKTTKAQTESVVAFLRSSREIVEPVAVPSRVRPKVAPVMVPALVTRMSPVVATMLEAEPRVRSPL